MKGKFIQYYNINWQGTPTSRNGFVISEVFTEEVWVSEGNQPPASGNGAWHGNNYTATSLGKRNASYVLTSCGSKVEVRRISAVGGCIEDLPTLPLTSVEKNSIIKERVARRKAERGDKPDEK